MKMMMNGKILKYCFTSIYISITIIEVILVYASEKVIEMSLVLFPEQVKVELQLRGK